MESSTFRLLRNALAEFFVDRYETEEWTQLGLRIDAVDEIQGHNRLLRSLRFGDDDYPVAAADITPKIMSKLGVQDDSTLDPWSVAHVDDLEYFADTFPELMTHFRSANPRMWRRVVRALPAIPDAWKDGVVEESIGITTGASQLGAGVNGQSPVSQSREPAQPAPEVTAIGSAVHTLDNAPGGEVEDRIFIAHGRDHGTRDAVRIYVQQITGIQPTILDAEINGGQTLIEKFERHAEASSIAIVLLTPDDHGSLIDETPLELRARQNVIFELGYFIGRLGRKKVIAINSGVVGPSDFAGVLYIPFEENWKELLRGELREVGVPIVD